MAAAKKTFRRYKKKKAGDKPITRKQAKTLISRRSERKYHDWITTAYAVGGSGSALVQCLSLIPNGNYDYQRNGDKVEFNKLSIRFSLVPVSSSLEKYSFRLMIVQVKDQSNSFTPTVATILQHTSSSAQSIVSMPLWDNKGRIKVLFDHTYDVGPRTLVTGTAYNGDIQEIPVKHHQRIKIPVRSNISYSAATTDHEDAIYLVCFSYDQNGLGGGPYLNFQSRLEFYDL